MGIDPFANCNPAIQEGCTLDTCCLAQSNFLYRPHFGGNLFFTVFFGVLIVPQLGLGVWRQTWGFGIGMLMGLMLEVVGYVARILLHQDPFNDNAFLMYLICLTIAPVFITAAIYLCLTRIMVLYGENLSFAKPRTIAITFVTSDFCSLLLQAIGGAIADTVDDDDAAQKGINVMIAGLLLQVISISVFLAFMVFFWWRSGRSGERSMDAEKQLCRRRPLFRVFLISLVVATIAVLVRSIFRVAELWGGFSGDLWNNETDFLVLDGAMMAVAVVLLSILHPGVAFGAQWSSANWSFKKGRAGNGDSPETSTS